MDLMDPAIKQTYDEYVARLTPVHQQALRSIDWQAKTIEVGHSFGLHVDELEDLVVETMLVLIGANTADQYPTELKERIPLPPAELDRLTSEIADQVFTPIHDRIVEGIPGTQESTITVTAPRAAAEAGESFPAAPNPIQVEAQLNRAADIEILADPDTESTPAAHPEISSATMIRAGIAPDMTDRGDTEAENAPQTAPSPIFSDQLRQILSGTTGTQDRSYPEGQ